MPSPIGSLLYIHNAIRSDISGIADDLSTIVTQGAGDVAQVAKRFIGHRHVLRAHELAEEEVLFPYAEGIQSGVTSELEATHEKNRGFQEKLEAALAANDAKAALPAAQELRDSMLAHLDHEEGEFIPFCDAKIPMDQQGALVGQMGAKMPPEAFPMAVSWMMRNSDFDNRVGVATMWAHALPAPVFAAAAGVIKESLSESDFNALVEQVPQLAG